MNDFAVKDSHEFRRIQALPRRTITFEHAEACAAELTPLLRKPGSTAALRPWQGVCLWELMSAGGLVAWLPVGQGKAQPNDTPVLTPDGWRPIGSLKAGDSVVGSSGGAIQVLGVFPQGDRPLMRMAFSDGSDVLCDEEHLWTLVAGDRNPSTRTAREWAKTRLSRPCGAHTARIWWLPPHPIVDSKHADLPLDPYTLGALLGDGCFRAGVPSFTTMDRDILSELSLPRGIVPRPKKHQNSGRATDYDLTVPRIPGRKSAENPLTGILRTLGLWGAGSGTKFVPEEYLRASPAQRLGLLQGLLDTDGCVCPGGIAEYSTMSPRLADAVTDIAESLGGVVSRNDRAPFRLRVKLRGEHAPFRCARKSVPYAQSLAGRQRPPRRALVAVTPAGRAECTCILVDAPDHLYLTVRHVLTHNTLISLLAALVMRAKRPILCLPAGLREKTLADFAALAREWRLPDPPPVIVPYESLTQVGNVDYLDQIQPDMIIRDESHRTRNLERSAAKRIDRYVRKHKPINVGMTGSPGRLSILDYAHDLIWCLDDKAPVPLVKGEREMWAAALDEKDPRMGDRPDPGPLGPDIDSAREWYRQRLISTPGVVIVDEDSCDQPLTIRTVYAPEDPALDAAFERFRKTWTTPDGWPMSDAFSVYRHAAELGTGMYLRWDPRPPEWWATPRKVFCGFVRDRIRETAHARRPLDTELAVRQAHPEAPEVTEWMAVRDGRGPNGEPPFRPNSVPVWVSGSVVRAALEWLRLSPLPGLVWCGNTAFGEVLAQQAGLRYYGPEGRALDGTSIMHIPGADNKDAKGNIGCGASCSAVLSVAANMQGRNLQGWSRALVINPPQSGMYLEQVIGRTHRSDQTRPVTIDVLVTSGDVADAFDAAWREATFGARTASLTQKILRARVERGQVALTEANQWRWARRSP